MQDPPSTKMHQPKGLDIIHLYLFLKLLSAYPTVHVLLLRAITNCNGNQRLRRALSSRWHHQYHHNQGFDHCRGVAKKSAAVGNVQVLSSWLSTQNNTPFSDNLLWDACLVTINLYEWSYLAGVTSQEAGRSEQYQRITCTGFHIVIIDQHFTDLLLNFPFLQGRGGPNISQVTLNLHLNQIL